MTTINSDVKILVASDDGSANWFNVCRIGERRGPRPAV